MFFYFQGFLLKSGLVKPFTKSLHKNFISVVSVTELYPVLKQVSHVFIVFQIHHSSSDFIVKERN